MRLAPPLLAAIAIGIALPAQATGGRLNSAGCHNSKKVGYHCHRAQAKKPVGKKPATARKPTSAPKRGKSK